MRDFGSPFLKVLGTRESAALFAFSSPFPQADLATSHVLVLQSDKEGAERNQKPTHSTHTRLHESWFRGCWEVVVPGAGGGRGGRVGRDERSAAHFTTVFIQHAEEFSS